MSAEGSGRRGLRPGRTATSARRTTRRRTARRGSRSPPPRSCLARRGPRPPGRARASARRQGRIGAHVIDARLRPGADGRRPARLAARPRVAGCAGPVRRRARELLDFRFQAADARRVVRVGRGRRKHTSVRAYARRSNLPGIIDASDRMPRGRSVGTARIRCMNLRHRIAIAVLASFVPLAATPGRTRQSESSRPPRTAASYGKHLLYLTEEPHLAGTGAQLRRRRIRARPLPRIRPRRGELPRVPGAAQLSEVRVARDRRTGRAGVQPAPRTPTRPTRTRISTKTRRRSPTTATRRRESARAKSCTRTAAAPRTSSASTAWASTSRARSC